MEQDTSFRANKTSRYYHVTKHDLPLSCPRPTTPLWNAHPKIYLPIEKARKVSCPYCGAIYILKDVV